MSQNPIQDIAMLLQNKSSAKQVAFKNLQQVFHTMLEQAQIVADAVREQLDESVDPDINVSVSKAGDNEFHMRIAGDLLVFVLHTNIVTLTAEHEFNKSPYVEENMLRKYLGQINVYNFMADSLTFNRHMDPGYLLARVFVNMENHFMVEGDGQLGFMFTDIAAREINTTDINIFVQLLAVRAIESDLVTPAFPSIRKITLQEKFNLASSLGMGQKIGFQMSYDREDPV